MPQCFEIKKKPLVPQVSAAGWRQKACGALCMDLVAVACSQWRLRLRLWHLIK